MDKEPMTLAGYNKITKDLEFLKKTERPETVIALEEARQLGDLKENAEYHSAKDKLKLIDIQIAGGLDYLVSLGTTGESVVLSDQEKIEQVVMTF